MNLRDLLDKDIKLQMSASLAFAVLTLAKNYLEKLNDCGCFTCKLRAMAAGEVGRRITKSIHEGGSLTAEEIKFIIYKLEPDSELPLQDLNDTSVNGLRESIKKAEHEERYEDAAKLMEKLKKLTEDTRHGGNDQH